MSLNDRNPEQYQKAKRSPNLINIISAADPCPNPFSEPAYIPNNQNNMQTKQTTSAISSSYIKDFQEIVRK